MAPRNGPRPAHAHARTRALGAMSSVKICTCKTSTGCHGTHMHGHTKSARAKMPASGTDPVVAGDAAAAAVALPVVAGGAALVGAADAATLGVVVPVAGAGAATGFGLVALLDVLAGPLEATRIIPHPYCDPEEHERD